MKRSFPFLLLLCTASGCAALIYEIVWLQLLQFSVGSTAVSICVLLATYMGGMCLGSLVFPRIVSERFHPLRVYGLLELGIGVCGILVMFGMPNVERLAGAGPAMRGAVCALCLLPGTLLMGASLPAISRWMQATPEGISRLGFLYGVNIAGAVFGCTLAGFYLLRVHDMPTATLAAATINGAVAAAAFVIAKLAGAAGSRDTAPTEHAVYSARGVYLAIALSGLCALGAEVVWTRLLSLMLGATVYTFSIILAVFLIGLGLGSGVGSVLARRVANSRMALGCCQILLTAAVAWTAYMLAGVVPYWHVAVPGSPWIRFRFDFLRALAAILPAACLWGASFPLALAAAARRGQDPGRLVGRIYAANTAGAIVGAVAFSLLLIPAIGTQNSQRVMVGISAAAAFVVLLGCWRKSALAGAAVAACLLAWRLPAVPWGAVAYGRSLPTTSSIGKMLYMGEGMNASIVISESDDIRFFHVSGKIEASNGPQDLRVERMLGHFPALLHPAPRSVLVVGCGAGITAGSFVPYPEVQRIVICEIERLIPPAIGRYFAKENYGVVHDPRTEIVYDDARHFILTTPEKFDVITSDPIHPWVKGAASLYTKEYFELCKRHLNPGGVVTQWVPLYESHPDTVKSEIATFFAAFPNGTVWGNESIFDGGYDSVMVGANDPLRIDIDALQRRLERPDYALVLKSIKQVGFSSAVYVLSTYAGSEPELRPWLRNAQINRDRNLRLQYLAGMGMNSSAADTIYDEMMRLRKFPTFVTGSDAQKQALKKALW